MVEAPKPKNIPVLVVFDTKKRLKPKVHSMAFGRVLKP